MVVTKTNRIEFGQLVDGEQRIEVFFPLVKAGGVAGAQIPAGISSTKMSFQYMNVWFLVIGKFAIGAKTYTCPVAMVPNKSFFIIGNRAVAFCRISTTAAAITGRPGFFEIVGCIGAHRPVMAIGAYFTINIKVI